MSLFISILVLIHSIQDALFNLVSIFQYLHTAGHELHYRRLAIHHLSLQTTHFSPQKPKGKKIVRGGY